MRIFSLPITYTHFNYSVLWSDIYSLISYSLLVATIILFYFIKNIFIRVALAVISIGFACIVGRLSWIAIPVVILLAGTFYYGFNLQRKGWRDLLFILLLIIIGSIIFRYIPGNDWRVVSNFVITPDAVPFSMSFRFTPTLIGLFFLGVSTYTLANGGQWSTTMKIGFVWGIFAVIILIPLSHYLGFVRYEWKLTNLFFLWAIHNLFFTCLVEETIFRGVIQSYLMDKWQNVQLGKWLALICAAILFGAFHFAGGMTYMILTTVAGIMYGLAFMYSGKIEASMLTHFMVNIVHFVAFTYPALKAGV